MNTKELERRLREAAEHTAPDDLEDILSRCGKQEGKVISMERSRAPKTRNWRALVAACLALVLVGGGAGVFYQQANAVTSVVSLDVNPSIELRINRDERVLSCTALNEEAQTVLAEMDGGADLEGAKLDVAVNAVVGALVRHGYLTGLSDAILVSVEDKDQNRAAQLEAELTQTIGGVLEAQAPNTTILSQSLPLGGGYGAHHGAGYGCRISGGKAALVQRVLTQSGTEDPSEADFEKLAALTVEELNDLLTTGEGRIPIGCAAASVAAEDYAGTSALSSVKVDVDPELDEGIYEVEIHTAWGEFEYRVDAFTGEILSGPANVPALAQPSETTPATETTAPPAVTPAPAATAPATATNVPTPAADLIGEDAAWTAACKHAGCAFGDIQFTACELDYEDGHPHCYEMEFCWNGNQYEYEVDCYTGAVLKTDWEVCDEARHGHHAASAADLIGEDAAWTAVYDHAGCGSGDIAYGVCELDYDDGVPQCYEVEFCWNGVQYEYEVDCHSGTILKYEHETCNNGYHGHGGRHRGWHH